MGWMHTQQRRHMTKGLASWSWIGKAMGKKMLLIKPNINRIGWNVSQALNFWCEHEVLRVQWTLEIPSKKMLERVWWCKCFEIKSLKIQAMLKEAS